MAKFRLLSKSYLDGVLYRNGAIIERPPNWLEGWGNEHGKFDESSALLSVDRAKAAS